MPSRGRPVRLAVWALLLLLVGNLSGLLLAQTPPSDPTPPPGPEEPWDKEPPDVVVPGKETEKGAEFETPFLAGVTSLAARFVDCITGGLVPPGDIETEYYFAEGATPPYAVGDLERVVVWALGYLPKEITEFETFSINLLFLTITVLYPAQGEGVCLMPSSGAVSPTWIDADVAHEQVPPPAPQPGTCGAQETERKVWKVIYHPTSVDVVRGQNDKGGLETTFYFNFNREKFWKARDRGPCGLTIGHAGQHSPWGWSAWREDGSELDPVTFVQTVGGWPEGMSASYFERWILGSCYQDLVGIGLTDLGYVDGSFDAREYYEEYVRSRLRTG